MRHLSPVVSLGYYVLIGTANIADASKTKVFHLIDSAANVRPARKNESKSCSSASDTVAAGIVADGAANVLVAVQTQTQPTSATITITNEVTLVPYDPNVHSYAPKAGSTTLTVSGRQIVEYEPGVYILANAQAPDILKPGADGGYTDCSQPFITTVTGPEISSPTTQRQVYPPPVLFPHGLWGSASSLAGVSNYLFGMSAVSQVAGCASGCVSQAFKNLADTKPVDSAAPKMFELSYANVVANPGVHAFVACKLANAACSADKPGAKITSATVPDRVDSLAAEPPRLMPILRRVKPLLITPASGTMGEDMTLNLRVPFEQVVDVSVNQIKDGRGYDNDVGKISRAPDGSTRVTITPLLTGRAQFDIVTTLRNHEFTVNSIYLNVASPIRSPLKFLADQTCRTSGSQTCVSHMDIGMEYNLLPILILRALPNKELDVSQFCSYTALQDAGHPVIGLDSIGNYKALREGKATIVVSYSGFKTSVEVVVDRSFPLMIKPLQ